MSSRLYDTVSLALCCLLICTGCKPKEEKNASLLFNENSAHPELDKVPISRQCGACHKEQFLDWASSDHAWAFRTIQPKHDSQSFHGQRFDNGIEHLLFSTDARQNRLITDTDSGQQWIARYALGRTPLVQYLVAAPDGGFHTTEAAWDVQKREWFDVFGNDPRQEGNWGHWRGRGMNWNTQCAWCHMSGFRKNYNPDEDRYHSTWKEPGVTCIQCHELKTSPDTATGCLAGGKDGSAISPQQKHDNCATCHARREELDDRFRVGDRFDDHYKLELPTREGIFYANGMQQDEDYCETGLRLSRMGNAGVTCLDCHNPHTGSLKLTQEDNALCLRCHANGSIVGKTQAPVIDPLKHTPCPTASNGARCVECHMPESFYMARDPRRDHSFNSPDPQLSIECNIPNACTGCHRNMSNTGAAEKVRQFYGESANTQNSRRRTRAICRAWKGENGASTELLTSLKHEKNGAWRATLLELLAGTTDCREAEEVALNHLTDESPLARAAAVRLLAERNYPQAWQAINDPFRVVRTEAGWALRQKLSKDNKARREAEATAQFQSDQPPGAMKLARFASEDGRLNDAERWYRKAIQWDPSGIVARHDYALFLSGLGRNDDALKQLNSSLSIAPEDADLHFKKALCLIELKRTSESMKSLDKAIELQPQFLRAIYNRAILHHRLGHFSQAINDLEQCDKLDAQSPEYSYFRGLILFENERYTEALDAALQANRRAPQHQATRQLIQKLINIPAVRKIKGL